MLQSDFVGLMMDFVLQALQEVTTQSFRAAQTVMKVRLWSIYTEQCIVY